MRADYREQCFPILEDFLGYLEIVKGRAVGTVEEYFIDLRTFFRFIKRKKGKVSDEIDELEIDIKDIDIGLIKQVTLLDVYEYMSFLKNEKGNTNSTLARKSCSLRVFFTYLTNNIKILTINPVENLETPRIAHKIPKYLSLEESLELLQMPEGEFAERDYCMLTLLLNCGLRRAELAALSLSDIGSDNTLKVTGKGNKERMLYLNEACLDALNRYLPTRPVDGVEKKYRKALFYSRLNKRISLQGIHYIIKGYLNQLENGSEYSTHKLRHTAATLMHRNGVDVRVLQDVLGHENLNTTQIYTHVSSEQIQKAANLNPLAHATKRDSKSKKK